MLVIDGNYICHMVMLPYDIILSYGNKKYGNITI